MPETRAPDLPRLPGRRPPSRGELRRLALLQALEDLLRERPLARIGVGDVTAAAGVARSGFYFYFPSKEAAVTELLGDVAHEMLGGAAAALDPATPRDRAAMRDAMAATVAAWRRHRHLVLATLDARAADPAVRELWDRWLDLFVVPVAALIAAERAAGAAPGGPDPELLARLLLGMNERALEQHTRSDAAHADDDQLVEALTTVWTTAIYGAPR